MTGAAITSSSRFLDVDPTHNEIFVTDATNFTVSTFSRTASGVSSTLRQIAGGATGLSTSYGVRWLHCP